MVVAVLVGLPRARPGNVGPGKANHPLPTLCLCSKMRRTNGAQLSVSPNPARRLHHRGTSMRRSINGFG